ncbi:MAG: DNA-directed RNA polymerase subunit A', partial [Nanoarchaeota archaeon]
METIYKKVGSVVFGLLSPEQIKKMATVKIVTPELYDKEGYSVDGGLMDMHLGVIDPGLRCRTCGGRLKECPGHFGHIELARPVIHIKYVKPICDALRSTCRDCSKILLPDNEKANLIDELERSEKEKGLTERRRKLKEILKVLKDTKKCPYCGGKQYTIKIEKPSSFYERDKRLSPIEIRVRLEKISDDDAPLIGLNQKYARPEWMVLTVLPIAPVTIRPSITLETGERSEDDLTHKLGDIVRINQRLFENINAG